MASREYEDFLAGFERSLICPDDDLETARLKLEALHGHPVAAETRVEHLELGGVRCAWIETPEARGSDRVLLLCHGGAWVAAGGDGYLFYAEMLSRPCAARVLLVDYRLAPEHRHPAAIEDCANAYRGLLETGVESSRVAFIGDSCGGGLALGSLLWLRNRELPMPALAVTLGGWFDLEARGNDDESESAWEPFAHPAFTRARARDYLGPEGDLCDPLAAPIHADLSGLPPLLLQSGQRDLTRHDALRLAERAARDGVDVTLEIHPEMIHGFQGLARAGIPEATAALERVARYVAARIPSGTQQTKPDEVQN